MKHPSFILGYVPEDIDENKPSVILYGNYYQLYQEALNNLRKELALEYLRDRDLKDRFWHFVCEIITGLTFYKDLRKLNEKVTQFLSDIIKPLEDYEVLIPILNLDVRDLEMRIGDITLKKFDEKALKNWGLPRENCPEVLKEIAGKSFLVIPEKGNNPRLVCNRAREKANFAIRVLQVALITNRFIYDDETLYKQSKWIIYKAKSGRMGLLWNRGYEPIPRDIGGDLERSINEFLKATADVLKEGELPPKLRKYFISAITWIGRAIEVEDIDIKIIYLSTALESILTTEADEMKGESLAYRMLLLNTFLDKTFVHPTRILWIYKQRSKVVHGSELSVASERVYYTIRHVALDTIIYALEVIRRTGVKSKADFIRVLESQDENVEKILNWLRGQGDVLSLRIMDYMKKHCQKVGFQEP